jgi:tetratricopeptide (TPR) repeat protein
VAWALVNIPSDPWFNPKEGLALAKKAVALLPEKWHFLNTLGVAAFRTGDFKTAIENFQRSTIATGGAAHDLFFLAMTYWQQGSKEEARAMFDKAVARADRDNPNDFELRLFRAEAAALLGEPKNKSISKKPQNCEQKTITTDSVQKSKPTPKDVLADILGAIGAITAPLHSGLL